MRNRIGSIVRKIFQFGKKEVYPFQSFLDNEAFRRYGDNVYSERNHLLGTFSPDGIPFVYLVVDRRRIHVNAVKFLLQPQRNDGKIRICDSANSIFYYSSKDGFVEEFRIVETAD